jgi:diadenosine tetraphosphate (Ap4A) HIT family hydrolase
MAHVLSEEEKFCLRGCRGYEQYYRMRKGFEDGACAFCQLDRTFNKVGCENDSWMMWEVPAQFVRKETALHLLIVPKRHIRFPWDLSAMEQADCAEMWTHICEHYKAVAPGGIVAIRFGDMEYNAGTVPHLHMNVMVPSRQGELRIPVFKTEDDAEGNLIRMAGFSAMYDKGETPQSKVA